MRAARSRSSLRRWQASARTPCRIPPAPARCIPTRRHLRSSHRDCPCCRRSDRPRDGSRRCSWPKYRNGTARSRSSLRRWLASARTQCRIQSAWARRFRPQAPKRCIPTRRQMGSSHRDCPGCWRSGRQTDRFRRLRPRKRVQHRLDGSGRGAAARRRRPAQTAAIPPHEARLRLLSLPCMIFS
jgi:hypothetical protein